MIAIYPASFDPPTYGHAWMIKQGRALFDRLIVGVAWHPTKEYAFSMSERIKMLRETTHDEVSIVDCGSMLLAHFAQNMGATHILRGLRGGSDFDYERWMQQVNHDISSAIQTVFLMPPPEMEKVSSSLVRGLCQSDGWENVVSRYVCPEVVPFLKRKYAK